MSVDVRTVWLKEPYQDDGRGRDYTRADAERFRVECLRLAGWLDRQNEPALAEKGRRIAVGLAGHDWPQHVSEGRYYCQTSGGLACE